MLKTKDKEIQNQQQSISNLRTEVTQLRSRLEAEQTAGGGVDKHLRYEGQLKEAEKRNNELVREVKTLQKIQNE